MSFDDFIAQLDEQSISALKHLIGARPFTISAPSLQVAGEHFQAPSLSFKRSDTDWITIGCELHGSPRGNRDFDYWQLWATQDSSPGGIQVRPDGTLVSPCKIWRNDTRIISSIEVRGSYSSWNDFDIGETATFDSALVFETEDPRHPPSRRFCIWCQVNGPGGALELHYTESRELIENVIKGTSLRLRLEKN